MNIEAIVVLLLTVITVAILVWIEMKSRRNQPAPPMPEVRPDPIGASSQRSKRSR